MNGKKFIFRGLSLGFWCQGMKRSLKELSDAIITSPRVIEVKLGGFDKPEALIAIADLVEKLPNCSGAQISDLTITEHTAPYLAKLLSFTWLRALALQQGTFTPEGCRTFADALDPDRFLVLSLEECNVPNLLPIFKVLERAKIDHMPFLVQRALTDEEFNGFANVLKVNAHLKKIYTSNMANKHTRMIAEALYENTGIQDVALESCDLVTAMPAIVKLLQTSKHMTKFHISGCGITLALLTELCEGLQERKSTTDLVVSLWDNSYTDSLEPIKKLLEANAQLPGLELTFNTSPQEWIRICESLKKNTTLKALNISMIQANKEAVDVLSEALKVNTTLRSLLLDTRFFSPVLDPIIIEILSKNKLEFAQLVSGELQDLDFKTICSLLKKNYRLKKIFLNFNPPVLDTEENVKIYQELLAENCFITFYNIIMGNVWDMTQPYVSRNQKYREEWTLLKANALVLLHNLARNADKTREMLHIDLWIEIFKRIHHPCSPADGFEKAAKKIFKQYKLY